MGVGEHKMVYLSSGDKWALDSTEEELPSSPNYKQERPQRTKEEEMLLAQLTLQPEYMEAVQNFCDFTVNYQKKTPKGLVYIDKFGTLGHAANVAFICLQVADIGISSEKYRDFVKSQIHYMLGDSGRSYVVGFGLNYPTQPYHAARHARNTYPVRLRYLKPHIARLSVRTSIVSTAIAQLISLRRLRDMCHWTLLETFIVIPNQLRWSRNFYKRRNSHKGRLPHPYHRGALLEGPPPEPTSRGKKPAAVVEPLHLSSVTPEI
ncbi:unnamed protein product [Timema podura]|uniref:cellulase n=1 Tax=Timema podura TaxID=61482 RepID=A0ABN7NK76_TIMPD|nr:unnamed protein product [Timema podura]